jgi:hypothetical protein
MTLAISLVPDLISLVQPKTSSGALYCPKLSACRRAEADAMLVSC